MTHVKPPPSDDVMNADEMTTFLQALNQTVFGEPWLVQYCGASALTNRLFTALDEFNRTLYYDPKADSKDTSEIGNVLNLYRQFRTKWDKVKMDPGQYTANESENAQLLNSWMTLKLQNTLLKMQQAKMKTLTGLFQAILELRHQDLVQTDNQVETDALFTRLKELFQPVINKLSGLGLKIQAVVEEAALATKDTSGSNHRNRSIEKQNELVIEIVNMKIVSHNNLFDVSDFLILDFDVMVTWASDLKELCDSLRAMPIGEALSRMNEFIIPHSERFLAKYTTFVRRLMSFLTTFPHKVNTYREGIPLKGKPRINKRKREDDACNSKAQSSSESGSSDESSSEGEDSGGK